MDSAHLKNSGQVLSEWQFFVRSIALLLVVSLHYSTSGAAQQERKISCQGVSTNNVTFLAFLPCHQRADNLSDVRLVLEECDLLTRAAISLAIEGWNQDESTNYTLNVASLSPVPYSNDHSTDVSKCAKL